MTRAPDVAVIGGGLLGCALAAFLAEDGMRVRLYERDAPGAGASGRNSGVLQHPLDPALAPLHAASLAHYRALGHGFALPEPAGVLVLSDAPEALAAERDAVAAAFPELGCEWLEGEALRAAEPGLAPGLAAYRLDTGRPVPPAAAAAAWAARAREAGAELRTGAEARARSRDGRVAGVWVEGREEPAGVVAVAAGAWSAAAAPVPVPVRPVWGVVAEVRLPGAPAHVLEEAGIDGLVEAAPPALFSLVTAAGASGLGSTFLPERPDPDALVPALRARGARFLPALADVALRGVRTCARPQSADGRPLLGPVPGVAGLVLATGHGPWGITLGPASARLVADALLGRGEPIPAKLAAGRFAAA